MTLKFFDDNEVPGLPDEVESGFFTEDDGDDVSEETSENLSLFHMVKPQRGSSPGIFDPSNSLIME